MRVIEHWRGRAAAQVKRGRQARERRAGTLRGREVRDDRRRGGIGDVVHRLARRDVGQIIPLQIAPDEARFQHDQGGDVAKLKAAVNRFARTALGRIAYRHPLVIGLQGDALAGFPIAFVLIGVVILCPIAPGIIGDLVVVPDGDPRRGGVGRLQVRIGFIKRVALAVIVQRDDLGRGVDDPTKPRRDFAAIAIDAIFIDVIAQMQHRIERIGAGGDRLIAVEIPERVIRAGAYGEIDRLDGALRQGLGAAGDGAGLADLKAVIIDEAGLEAGHVDFDGVITLGIGGEITEFDDLREVFVLCHHPTHRHGPVSLRGNSRPHNDAIQPRIAAGDPMGERHRSLIREQRLGLRASRRRRAKADGAQLQQIAA